MDEAERRLLSDDRWFGSVPARVQDALLGAARPVTLAAGECAYRAGDPPNGLWAVLEGQVRLKSGAANGLELLALQLRPGNWFGELSTLDGRERPHDAVAFVASRLLHIAPAAFERAAAAEPGIFRHVGVLACRHQRAALDFITQAVAQPLPVRIADTLLRSMQSGDPHVRLRQDELAALAGVSRQSLNRHLQALERGGLIRLGYGVVTILQEAGLRAFCAR